MQLISVRTSSLAEMNERASIFIAACGFEHRSIAIAKLASGPKERVAICFEEWPLAIARPKNEKEFKKLGFSTPSAAGSDSRHVQRIVAETLKASEDSRSIAFDVSSMTRAWHGGIVRQFRTMEIACELETFFAYVPSEFKPPSSRVPPNEIVAPVDGFASLAAPDLPIAAVIGLGYERERALGLQQFLDPELTLLMIPKHGDADPYYAELRRNNRGLLDRTDPKWIFEYDLNEPAAAFSTLASVIAGLRESYRVVLTSLGPKAFGLICFLLATKFKDVSVWRVSAGAHGKPKDAYADLKRLVVMSAMWKPSTDSDPDLK